MRSASATWLPRLLWQHIRPRKELRLWGLGCTWPCCTQITDAGLAPLARGLTRLRCLDLSGCVAVTERGLAALAAYLGALQTLKLGGTSRCAAG